MMFDRRTNVVGLVINTGVILFILLDDQTANSKIWDLFLTHRGREVSPWSWVWFLGVMAVALVYGVVVRKCYACGGFWALHPNGETGRPDGRHSDEWECKRCDTASGNRTNARRDALTRRCPSEPVVKVPRARHDTRLVPGRQNDGTSTSLRWRRFRSFRIDPFPRIVAETTEPRRVKPMLDQQSRGTRGSRSAVSSGEDGLVLRQLIEA